MVQEAGLEKAGELQGRVHDEEKVRNCVCGSSAVSSAVDGREGSCLGEIPPGPPTRVLLVAKNVHRSIFGPGHNCLEYGVRCNTHRIVSFARTLGILGIENRTHMVLLEYAKGYPQQILYELYLLFHQNPNNFCSPLLAELPRT
jgi:hypothetical protein